MSSPELRKYPGTTPEERTYFTPYSAFDIPADLRELSGRYDVNATARRVRNFRYAEEWTMMMLGGWMATVPEIPVKTGIAKITWESAQAADTLGKRLPELRCGRKQVEASEVANEGFAGFVQAVTEPEDPDLTVEKLAGVFDVLKPHLIEVYEDTIRSTDQIADAPTIEILEDIVRKTRRHVAWGQEVLDRLCDTDAKRERRRIRKAELLDQLRACGGVTGEGIDRAPTVN
ncbi:MAG: hypothetical protein O7A09_15055 [Proteobacteria bacterium]|nr:hypothetical protein [Pseudomonadota bacterium]